ncbi:MAG: tRNA (adenosine(37)-N6)-dimethylallyltransferase MiaA [Bacteroidota bacterium]|nr:tRNA (adenosine(37)-N6)-dimethylallyltransferase MiaA [Bacteroidota bacterium]
MLQKQNTVIVIAGPTAVGKTAVAVQLAQHFNTQIISADSRQCYKELNIGVAKPTPAQLSAVHHYFINSHSIHQTVNAALFEEYALQCADEIFAKQNIAIVVGGTGLYIKAFCEGLDDIPVVPNDVRNNIINQYKNKGISFLQDELEQKDKAYWQVAERQNPQRLMRALEVLYATGNSILFYQNTTFVQRPFNIIKIGLELGRETLYQRINFRVDEMIKEGLSDEVKGLVLHQNLNALQTVGYKELFDYLNNKADLPTAIKMVKQNTRNYAKRQMTWFKKDEKTRWFSPEDFENIVAYLNTKIQ